MNYGSGVLHGENVDFTFCETHLPLIPMIRMENPDQGDVGCRDHQPRARETPARDQTHPVANLYKKEATHLSRHLATFTG